MCVHVQNEWCVCDIQPWIFTEIKEQRHWDITSNERLSILKDFVHYGLQHWGSDSKGMFWSPDNGIYFFIAATVAWDNYYYDLWRSCDVVVSFLCWCFWLCLASCLIWIREFLSWCQSTGSSVMRHLTSLSTETSRDWSLVVALIVKGLE